MWEGGARGFPLGLGLKTSDNRMGSTAEPALVRVPTGGTAAQLAPVEREARAGGRRSGPALALKGVQQLADDQPVTEMPSAKAPS